MALLVQTHEVIKGSGFYNFEFGRIPVRKKLLIQAWRRRLQGYSDEGLVEFLEFGWPIGSVRNNVNPAQSENHASALHHEKFIDLYIQKELQEGSLIGPFETNPFSSDLYISPLSSVDKDEKSRRVIVDLSYPSGNSVNDTIPKDEYMGKFYKLKFPTVDTFREMVYAQGHNCLMYKRDLKRAYRQFPVDPHDFNKLGLKWKGLIYIDTALPMGMRTSAMACQRATNAVSFICQKEGYKVLNYIDDFVGVEQGEKAWRAFQFLGHTLQELGLVESVNKTVEPSTCLQFLRVKFDSVAMTISVTASRVEEIRREAGFWVGRKEATKRQLQSLLGKLAFVTNCVPPARVFTARMLNQIRVLKSNNQTFQIGPEIKADLEWWIEMLPHYNGVNMIVNEKWSDPDQFVESDACLSGSGAICPSQRQFFQRKFPEFITSLELHINCLELLTLLVAVRLWGRNWKGNRICIFCDNITSVSAVNTGKSRDKFSQACIRELFRWQSICDFQLKAVHLAGDKNRTADYLSRAHMGVLSPPGVDARLQGCVNVEVSDELFALVHD